MKKAIVNILFTVFLLVSFTGCGTQMPSDNSEQSNVEIGEAAQGIPPNLSGMANGFLTPEEARDWREETSAQREAENEGKTDPWKEMEPRNKDTDSDDTDISKTQTGAEEDDSSHFGPWYIMVDDTHEYEVGDEVASIPYRVTLMTFLQNDAQRATDGSFRGFIYLSFIHDVAETTGSEVISGTGINQVISQCNDVKINLLPYSEEVRQTLGIPNYLNTMTDASSDPLLAADADGLPINIEEAEKRDDVLFKREGREDSEIVPIIEFDYYAKFTVPMNYIYLSSVNMTLFEDGEEYNALRMGKPTADTLNVDFVLRVTKYGEWAVIDLLGENMSTLNHHPFKGRFRFASNGGEGYVEDFKDKVIEKRDKDFDQIENENSQRSEQVRKENYEKMKEEGMSDEEIRKVEEAIEVEDQIIREQRDRERQENMLSDANGFAAGGVQGATGGMSVSQELPAALQDHFPLPEGSTGTTVLNTAQGCTLTYQSSLSIQEIEDFYKDTVSGLSANPNAPTGSAFYTGTIPGYKTVTVMIQADGKGSSIVAVLQH